MKKYLLVAAAIVTLSVLSLVPLARQARPLQSSNLTPRRAWERMMSAPITDIDLSSNGRCVAVSTSQSFVVFDSAGLELWRWDFTKDNRFAVAQKLAVSPKCDWVAFAGGPEYRYLWIVHQHGSRIPIKTEGTPLSVAISHTGTSVAIGTGAGSLALYSSEGKLQWNVNAGGGQLPVQEISFAVDDHAIMVSSYAHAIVSATGKPLSLGGAWGVGSMRAARDFKTFVTWGEPPHGPGIGQLSVLDGNGNVLWSKVSTDPRAIISPAGDLVVAQTNDNQNPSEEDGFEPQRLNLSKALRLFSKTGTVVRTFSAHGSPVAFSSDGRSFVLSDASGFVLLDLNETPLWNISKSGYPGFVSTPDFRSVVLTQNNLVEWYSFPN